MDSIDIDKTLVPYKFDINLSSRIYTFVINYNVLFDFFTADLLLNGSVLVKDEKLVLNQFLFRDISEDSDHNQDPNFPSELLFVGTTDNTIKRISYDNLGDTVFLYCISRNEVIE